MKHRISTWEGERMNPTVHSSLNICLEMAFRKVQTLTTPSLNHKNRRTRFFNKILYLQYYILAKKTKKKKTKNHRS